MIRAISTVHVVAAAVCCLTVTYTGGDWGWRGVGCTVVAGRAPSTGAQSVAGTATTHTQTRVYARRNIQESETLIEPPCNPT